MEACGIYLGMDTLARQYSPYFRSREDALSAGLEDDDIIHTADEFFCAEDDAAKCDGCGTAFADRYELNDDWLCEECSALNDEYSEWSADWASDRGVGNSPFGGW